MHLSKKIAGLKPSPTLSLNAKAQELASKGTRVYNFSVGEPDYGTPQIVVDAAIESLRKGRTKYGTSGGGMPLRQAIADKLKRDNHLEFKPNEIVVGSGAKEILFHIFMAMLNEGDEVLLSAPYWVSYTAHAEAVGALCREIPIPDDHFGPRLTPGMIEATATPKTKAIVLNSPNNPAGYVMKEAELKELGKYLFQKDWWIISDEIYEYMTFGTPHLSLLQVAPELRDRFILVNGLSKGFAMTGWRVGYAAAPAPMAKLIQSLQSHSSTCLPGFIEDAAVVALKQGPGLMQVHVEELKHRRDLAMKSLHEIPGLSMIPPEGAFYIYMDIRKSLAQAKTPMSSMQFSEFLLETQHVAMVPGEAFGTPGFLRLSYAIATEDLMEGIRRLALGLKAIQKG